MKVNPSTLHTNFDSTKQAAHHDSNSSMTYVDSKT